ncbi:MAG: hypothetical protein HQ534_08995 [Armatimonadetes bacterium]|nr:hypothetical protein [Armatimonadota bacterium]
MDLGNWISLGGFIVAVGVVLVATGKAVSKLDYIEKAISTIQGEIKIIPLLDERIKAIQRQISGIWTRKFTVSNSPLSLNTYGKKILKVSGIKKVIEEHYKEILEDVRILKPKTALQGQESIIAIVLKFKLDENLKTILENGAFESGVDVDTVLAVGAIDIRDKMLEDIGFNINDLKDESLS